MSDHYQLVTVESIQKDEVAILKILAAIMDNKLSDDLKLLNYFKEIPVSFPATIDHIAGDMVELTVHPSQAVAMLDQKTAFLKSSHFPYDVVAMVQRVRVERKHAVVSRLSYAHIRSERRENVRVEVMGVFDVVFRGANFSYRGRLHDISLSGLSFIVSDRGGIGKDLEGEASVFLPSSVIDVPAKLLRVLNDDDGKRYILKLDPTSRIENAISLFIFQQQAEIIKELKGRA
jgi:hypothetical protein